MVWADALLGCDGVSAHATVAKEALREDACGVCGGVARQEEATLGGEATVRSCPPPQHACAYLDRA